MENALHFGASVVESRKKPGSYKLQTGMRMHLKRGPRGERSLVRSSGLSSEPYEPRASTARTKGERAVRTKGKGQRASNVQRTNKGYKI